MKEKHHYPAVRSDLSTLDRRLLCKERLLKGLETRRAKKRRALYGNLKTALEGSLEQANTINQNYIKTQDLRIELLEEEEEPDLDLNQVFVEHIRWAGHEEFEFEGEEEIARSQMRRSNLERPTSPLVGLSGAIQVQGPPPPLPLPTEAEVLELVRRYRLRSLTPSPVAGPSGIGRGRAAASAAAARSPSPVAGPSGIGRGRAAASAAAARSPSPVAGPSGIGRGRAAARARAARERLPSRSLYVDSDSDSD